MIEHADRKKSGTTSGGGIGNRAASFSPHSGHVTPRRYSDV
jgi:hypothetical protein